MIFSPFFRSSAICVKQSALENSQSIRAYALADDVKKSVSSFILECHVKLI